MEDGFIANYIVKVNDKIFEEQVCGPHTYCYLVKMDTSKDEYTFVLGQDGPSDDYSSIFVRYKNDELVKYGEVGGKYDYLHLTPISVSSQVVAGINYMFTCTQKMGEEDVNQVTVKIFAPLPGRGEPELVEVIR